MGYRQANASLYRAGAQSLEPSQWSGGSSSGSGSAVAAGLVPFAIGTETWGSITTPASYCGLTGLRPTYGRVSRAGAMALSWTLDKIGPMARTAHDCGLVLDAIAGPDPDDPSASERPYALPAGRLPRPPLQARRAQGRRQGRAARGPRRTSSAPGRSSRRSAPIEEVDRPDWPVRGRPPSPSSTPRARRAFEELVDSGEIAALTAPEDRIGGYGCQVDPGDRVPPRPPNPCEARPRARCLPRPVRRGPRRADPRRRPDGDRPVRRPIRWPLALRPRQPVRHPRPRPPHRPHRRRPPHRPAARRPGVFGEPPAGPGDRVPASHRLARTASPGR